MTVVAGEYSERAYHLGVAERSSIDEIREALDLGKLQAASKDDSLSYLSELKDKLLQIYRLELENGIINEEVPIALSEIRLLIKRLEDI